VVGIENAKSWVRYLPQALLKFPTLADFEVEQDNRFVNFVSLRSHFRVEAESSSGYNSIDVRIFEIRAYDAVTYFRYGWNQICRKDCVACEIRI
jgi:hypothetical protein